MYAPIPTTSAARHTVFFTSIHFGNWGITIYVQTSPGRVRKSRAKEGKEYNILPSLVLVVLRFKEPLLSWTDIGGM
jgi:hypothetical protein